MRLKQRYIVFGLFLLMSSPAVAQQSNASEQFRLAQQLANEGDWEHALPLYRSLWDSSPSNFMYYDGLCRCYLQLKDYPDALMLIRQRLAKNPNDPALQSTLAGVLYDAGDEHGADSLWDAVIASAPTNVNLYRLVANEMSNHRLHERVILLYRKGRRASKNESLFAENLAPLFSALQRYAEAAQEYVLLLHAFPERLPAIQVELSSSLLRKESWKPLTETVGNGVDKKDQHSSVRKLSAWLLEETDRFDESLEQRRIIDRAEHEQGTGLFEFGQRMLQAHQPRVAAAALKEMLDRYPDVPLVPQGRFFSVLAEEELALSDSAHILVLQTVLDHYAALATAYPASSIALQAWYRIALLKFEQLSDFHGALSALQPLFRVSRSESVFLDAHLLASEIYLAQNDLSHAHEELNAVSESRDQDYADQALFHTAKLFYFEGKIDTAVALLHRFDATPEKNVANDALELEYFLEENKDESPRALQDFSHADLLFRQKHYSEALVHFEQIIHTYSQTLLYDDALMKKAELQQALRHPLDAVQTLSVIADSLQYSVLKDRAEFRIGELYQNDVHKPAAAMEAYQTLLERYPNSLFVDEARTRIRLLRGDIPVNP